MPLSDKQFLQINQAIFSLAQAYYDRMAHKEEGMTDFTLPYRAVLMVVGQLEPLNSRQLSQYMNINPGTISQYVQHLITQGLLEKKQDQNDRRNWWLTLTRKGRNAYQETVKGAVAYTRDFISTLSENEKITFHRLMVKISHSLGFEWQ